MFLHLKNLFYMSSAIIVLIQLFSAFGTTNGIELPLELLHHEGVNGAAKSRDYVRRMTFPLATSDNGVELPPNVEDNNMDLNGPNGFSSNPLEDNDDLDDELPIKSEMPQWLQMQLQQTEVQPQNNYHNHHSSSLLPKHKQSSSPKHHHESRQLHASSSSANSSPLRRCSIEISSKIPGICQTMGSVGNACVSGDYIDVFNAACL